MEEMSYEVSYDLLIDYANNLLESPKDTKKKRLGTYQERIAPTKPNCVKEKKKKEDQWASMSTSTRITRSIQIKKEPVPKVYENKPTVTRKRSRHIILQEESEETKPEEESKKMKVTGKKSKPVGEIPKQSTHIDVTCFKPMSDFERTLKILRRKWFDNVKEHFDSFDEGQKQEVVQEVINCLCQNNRLPQDIQKNISESLYLILENKWRLIIDQDQEILDRIFVQYFPELSHEELLEMLAKYKWQFHSKTKRLRLLDGKIQTVVNDTHRIAQDIQKMNEQLKGYHNKPYETKIGVPLELDNEEVIHQM